MDALILTDVQAEIKFKIKTGLNASKPVIQAYLILAE